MSARGKIYSALLGGVAAAALLTGAARAEDLALNIAPQPLGDALNEFAVQSKHSVVFAPGLVAQKTSPGVTTAATAELALAELLDGSGLSYRKNGDTFLIVSASDPQSGSAAGDGADGTVAALIVTAQKREEQIQDVPIAISAFTEKSLQEQKIEGGFDLLKAIPNVTFSKNNFTSYNFSIRGIGTKAVSATTDPGVAVSFNNIALIQNRLFEQEYFDVERVEVLRGPQGTLYGRNATAGVINVISAKPNLHEFDGWLKGEVGNYHTKRVSAMVNVPLVEDKLAIRFAGALTNRQGYDFNTGTNHAVNGRDLWSGRITIGFNPTERIRSNLIWERFNEDDNRSRTGKQLCHRDPGHGIAGYPESGYSDGYGNPDAIADKFYGQLIPALFSQGCKPGSLYDDQAFGTPNGLALPFVFGPLVLGANCGINCSTLFPMGHLSDGTALTLLKVKDPYGGMMQSRDLRVISSFRDPVYRAKADVVELNLDFDVTPDITFSSQTAYDKDTVYSFQDYNRFNTVPVFNDTSGLVDYEVDSPTLHYVQNPLVDLAPGGVLCDPQLGCSKSLAGFDISQGKAKQFSQEIRLQSSFSGPVNFSVGANYTQFNALVDYYVFYNLITAIARTPPFQFNSDITKCTRWTGSYIGFVTADYDSPQSAWCPYIDPNPIESLQGDGHNYFRSKNPYKLRSWAAFGEVYWQATDTLKVTAGLRYTDDRKQFTLIPSQVLTAPGLGFGYINRGYPEVGKIKQKWGEVTGRAGVDWKPKLSFTDQTMVYAFYSRGYKGGGANPPGIGFAQYIQDYLPPPDYGPTFRPEFVNAYEVGSKNTLLGGALLLNADTFFYDYKDYQVSEIKDRTAVNNNFDARVWGVELESVFSLSRDLRINGNIGYLNTRIADGMKSVDVMNRTQSNPNYVVVKPWFQFPSNCVVPLHVAENFFQITEGRFGSIGVPGLWAGMCAPGSYLGVPYDPDRGELYNPANYPELNGGTGIAQELGGNQLPNSPHWTTNVGAQYGFDFLEDWRATVRGDAYWQSQSWARVYNAVNDKLHGWYNVNLSMWLENQDGLKIELYAKNLLDKSPITDAFLNSDDTALTTNVFTLDPRLIGLSIRKEF